MGVVITLSLCLTPKASMQRCKAAVPLDTATEYFEPIYSEKVFSNSAILGPWVRFSDFRTSTTASISCGVIF